MGQPESTPESVSSSHQSICLLLIICIIKRQGWELLDKVKCGHTSQRESYLAILVKCMSFMESFFHDQLLKLVFCRVHFGKN